MYINMSWDFLSPPDYKWTPPTRPTPPTPPTPPLLPPAILAWFCPAFSFRWGCLEAKYFFLAEWLPCRSVHNDIML